MNHVPNRYYEFDGTPVEESHSLLARLVRPPILGVTFAFAAALPIVSPLVAPEAKHTPVKVAFLYAAAGIAVSSILRYAINDLTKNLQSGYVIDRHPSAGTPVDRNGYDNFHSYTMRSAGLNIAVPFLSLSFTTDSCILATPFALHAAYDFYRSLKVDSGKWQVIPRSDMEQEQPIAAPALVN